MKHYFKHDIGARNDLKLQKLLMALGCEGWGIYWALVEMLYENEGCLPFDQCSSIAYALKTEQEKVVSVMLDFGLFVFNKENRTISSARASKEIDTLNQISETRKRCAMARWSPRPVVKEEAKAPTTGAIASPRKPKKELDLSFVDSEWLDLVQLWIAYKKERKESYVQVGIKAFYTKLQKLSGGDLKKAEEIINQSFANNWAGIFALKDNGYTKDNRSLQISDFNGIRSTI